MTRITEWSVDYGNGPQPCSVPHAWRQDVDVRWEGPAVYRTTVRVPHTGGWLVFDGVGYAARVFVAGREAAFHEGIWDAFKVELEGYKGSEVEIRVEVVKNGGPSYLVPDVASGFLPFVFNTFGGIWQDVWLCDSELELEPVAPPCRVRVHGTKIEVDGKAFYMRGVLTWGWYPEIGHPNPPDEVIRKEVRLAKELGFNTIKFCLWVPSHRFFEILEEEGMFAWLELPLWDPSPDAEKQEVIFRELRRIVLQYRRHSHIVAWTCGCELSSNTTAEYRKRLYDMVKELTGAALVKDNSGSSEMYGGDLREYGDFYDFHPYCDTPFYPVVLDSLMNGPREAKPILLGEFNDIDVHRDHPRLIQERPFWASDDPSIADQGARWYKPDLPRILKENRFAGASMDSDFGRLSAEKSSFIRTKVQQAVRSREDIAGYVITGWRHTPISTSGVVDDWLQPTDTHIHAWNGEVNIFPIPSRKPPWVKGGNRPGWLDPNCHFAGATFLRFGAHSVLPLAGQLEFRLLDASGKVVSEGNCPEVSLPACVPSVVGELHFRDLDPGSYGLELQFGGQVLLHSLSVFPKPDFTSLTSWSIYDPGGHLEGIKRAEGPNILATHLHPNLATRLAEGSAVILLLREESTKPMPSWRECAYEFPHGVEACPTADNWHVLHAVSGDAGISIEALAEYLGAMEHVEVFLNRIDTRSYAEHPILLRAKVGRGTLVATTLRPYGGLGVQPYGVLNNPAGAHLLAKLIDLAEE